MQEKGETQSNCKKAGRGRAAGLKAQAAASWIALVISACVLAAAIFYSSHTLRRLDESLTPLVDEALKAADDGDGARLQELSVQIKSIVQGAEMKLTIVAGHRDITELKRYANELAALGEDGGRDSCIADLNGIRSILSMLIESSGLTIRNIL